MITPTPLRDQFTICTRDCHGRCCRYITVEVPAPLGRADWDEMRWWLAHEGVMVSKDEDGWMLHVQVRCKNLRQDNACEVYPYHMETCKDYDASNCEYTGPLDHEFELREELDLARYIERRGLKRAAPIARDIRRAHEQRPVNERSELVELAGLSDHPAVKV